MSRVTDNDGLYGGDCMDPDELVDGVPIEWLLDLADRLEEEGVIRQADFGRGGAQLQQRAANIYKFLRRKGITRGQA